MTNLKSIRLDKQLHYELFLLFEWFKGKTVKDIFERLPQGYCSQATIYNYFQRWKRATRKARELTTGW